MDSIREFDEIRATIDELRQEKTTACIRNMYGMCTSNMVGLADLKRYKEMQRIIQSKRRWSVGRFVKKYSMELLKFVKVWMMTPEIVSEILPLTNELFDIVIFDEASQLYVEKGVPAISRGKQIIIAGDHKQLKPSSLGIGRMEYLDEAEEQAVNYGALEEESLLDLARFRYKNVMLNYHYRAKYEELINFSNYAFYNGKLFVSPNMTIPEKPPIEVHYTENALWRGRNNIEEAKYIISLLKDFFATRKGSETVGIITFNTNQRDLILQMLEQACRDDAIFASQVNTEKMRTKDGEDIGLFVKNIENVQGDERDVIIFSIGYAKNTSGKLVHNFGWLNQDGGENRLNVAISRAKEKIHIVQSFRPDELHVEAAKNEGPRIFKKYLEYAEAISTGNKKAEKEILLSFGDTLAEDDNVRFDSPFEEQVYDALVERGYQVHSQIGVGGYSIDLAIKKDGKYLLGIECDGALYHSSATAKERDYYRQKYLETRGWTIHRIWSSNWWRDPQAEVEKICAKVQQIEGGPKV
jgi:superfamily I DNA and/or RNA helicase